MAKKQPRKKSQATQLRERNRRIDDLYINRGYRPPEIADILIDEQVFDARQSAYALRFVQKRVQEIRGDAPADKLLKLQRPAEAERARRQLYKLLRDAQNIIDCNDEVERQKVTPKGDVVTVNEPRYSDAEKGKAIKTAMQLVERIAQLNSVDTKTGLTDVTGDPAGADKAAAPARAFNFNMSGKPIESLIADRVGGGSGGSVN